MARDRIVVRLPKMTAETRDRMRQLIDQIEAKRSPQERERLRRLMQQIEGRQRPSDPWYELLARQLQALDPEDPNYREKASGLRLNLMTGKSSDEIAAQTLRAVRSGPGPRRLAPR